MISTEHKIISKNNCLINEEEVHENSNAYHSDAPEKSQSFILMQSFDRQENSFSLQRKKKLSEALLRNIKRRLQATQQRF
jgi:hypothetical protein